MLFEPVTTDHPLCVFIHMGKTGGNSLTNTFVRDPNFQGVGWCNKLDELTLETIEDLNFLGGHCKKKHYEGLDRNIELVTMLRNPVGRFVSLYNWIKGYLDGQPRRRSVLPGEGWLERREQADPELVRSLYSFERYISYFEKYPNKVRTQIADINKAIGMWDPETTIDDTIDILSNEFRFVGITELFEETIRGLCRIFGWPVINQPWNRIGSYEPQLTIDDLNTNQTTRISTLLQGDIKLYKLMRERFENYFCNTYSLADYRDYKATCIARDELICRNVLDGGSEYIPSNFFANSKTMETLKAEIEIQKSILPQQ